MGSITPRSTIGIIPKGDLRSMNLKPPEPAPKLPEPDPDPAEGEPNPTPNPIAPGPDVVGPLIPTSLPM